ncbi:hypothetical protein E2C01_000402 [Portunus trituberculatus]|uniref:Uncharacterized protein n=1 Tax=Portunus trituberculatus TaxID=210409 RepID=A0A5B7CGI1_PORTR|nr:hypothetical protein [Portunus trituberculatus]
MDGGYTVRQVDHENGRKDRKIAVRQAGEEHEGDRRECSEAGGLVEEVHEGDGRAGRQVKRGLSLPFVPYLFVSVVTHSGLGWRLPKRFPRDADFFV